MTMPSMPLRLPARDETGEDKPFSARMKRTPAIEIEKGCDVPRHFFSFFLYIASMRLVTKKPPKIFTAGQDQGEEAQAALEVQEPAVDAPAPPPRSGRRQ